MSHCDTLFKIINNTASRVGPMDLRECFPDALEADSQLVYIEAGEEVEFKACGADCASHIDRVRAWCTANNVVYGGVAGLLVHAEPADLTGVVPVDGDPYPGEDPVHFPSTATE
jgi:hypothetical protein